MFANKAEAIRANAVDGHAPLWYALFMGAAVWPRARKGGASLNASVQTYVLRQNLKRDDKYAQDADRDADV
jgi:hypothetical protein